MDTTRKRIFAYGSATALAGALFYGGFLYSPPPDLWTILSSVDTQLRLAYTLPARDRDGNLLSERERMLDDVAALLDQADAQQPDFAPIAEYRGFLLGLRGDFRGAAEVYRSARGMQECTPDLRDSLVFNEARMLRRAGAPAEALQLLEQERGTLQAKYVTYADLDRARLLIELGRKEPALVLARDVGAQGAEDPVAAVRAGEILEELGRPTAADSAYEAAALGSPVANYYRSRLKAGTGEVDRALELLELAAAADRAVVRKLVEKDERAWQGLAGTARFRELMGSSEASARPGR